MTLREHIQNWLTEAEKDLRENYERLGLKASGQWGEELESNIKEIQGGYKASIFGSAYTGVMESGRKPNTNQSPESLRAWVGWAGSTILKDWVERKGIQANPYAVAYKIAREGIQVPNRYNAGGVVSGVINDERFERLMKGVSLILIENIKSDVLKTLKNGSN